MCFLLQFKIILLWLETKSDSIRKKLIYKSSLSGVCLIGFEAQLKEIKMDALTISDVFVEYFHRSFSYTLKKLKIYLPLHA